MDRIGIISSTLCMLHCLATPFLFLAAVCSTSCCSDAPIWWKIIDYFFLIISLVAVYSVCNKSKISWLKISLWTSWFLLLIIILNHTFQIISINSNYIYIPGVAIALLHFYNLKFCSCDNEACVNIK